MELSSPSTMMMSADDGVTSDSLMAILLRLRYESTSAPSDGSMTSTSAPWSANISPARRPLSRLAFSMMRTPSYGRRGAAAASVRLCLSAATHSAGAARRPSAAGAARSSGERPTRMVVNDEMREIGPQSGLHPPSFYLPNLYNPNSYPYYPT